MKELFYEDLLTVPYLEFGRTKDGMDCYGLVLEMCRRNGKPLIDFVYHDKMVKNELLDECLGKVNVTMIEAEERNTGDIVEWNFQGCLHVGFLLDRNTVIHMTFSGVRIIPLCVVANPRYGKVVKW